MSTALIEENYSTVKWTGVWSGLLTAIVVYLFLAVLGMAIGLLTVPGGAETSATTVAVGAVIWLIICTIVSAYAGGFAASRTSAVFTNSQGRYAGAITGMLLVLLLTAFTVNTVSAGIGAIFDAAGSVLGMGARAGSRAAGAVSQGDIQNLLAQAGLQDEYQSVVSGLDRDQLNQTITQAVPGLAPEQANAVVQSVQSVLTTARNNLTQNLGNIAQLPETLNAQVNFIEQQLSAPQFTQQLQSQGLNPQQAQQATGAVLGQVQEMRQRGQQAVQAARGQLQEAARTTARTVSTAGWAWLASVILIIGSALLGGQNGARELPRYILERRSAEAANREAEEARIRQRG